MSNTKTIILDISYMEDTLELKRNNYDKNKSYSKEFKFNIKVIKLIKQILELNGVNVILAQPLNSNEVSLKDKIALEKEMEPKADGLISIQINKNSNKSLDDWIFYWHTSHESGKLAAFIDRALDASFCNRNRDITASMPDSWNDFQILKDTTCPSVIIEYSCIYRGNDSFFNNKYSMISYALSISEGIMEFLNIKNYVLKNKKNKLIILIEGTIKLLNKILNRMKEKEKKNV